MPIFRIATINLDISHAIGKLRYKWNCPYISECNLCETKFHMNEL